MALVIFSFLYASMLITVSHGEVISMKIPIGLPLIAVHNEDQWCTAYNITSDRPLFLKSVRPVDYGQQVTLLGCAEVTYPDGVTAGPTSEPPQVWRCRDRWFVETCQRLSQYSVGPTGRIGLLVGGDTGINSLVLAYHYHIHHDDKIILNATSDSGTVTFDLIPADGDNETLVGDVVNMKLVDGVIPPLSVASLSFSCHITEPVSLFPYAMTYHFHDTAIGVDGYVLSPDGSKRQFAKLRDPHALQAKMSIDPNAVVHNGDSILVTCTYNNTFPYHANIGLGELDEMCLIHIYYFVKDGHRLSFQNCF